MPAPLLSSVVDQSTTKSRDPEEVDTDSAKQPCTLGKDWECEKAVSETLGMDDTMLMMEWERMPVEL